MAQPKRKEKVDEKDPSAASDGARADASEAGRDSGKEVGRDAQAKSSDDDGAAWSKPAALPRLSLGLIIGAMVVLNLPIIHYFVFRGAPEATASLPYGNDFSDPASVTRDFFSTGGLWRTVNGELLSPGVKNNPLWLKAKLPQNVAVEFDVRSTSPEGDIKAEIFGDGSDHATGYILIHGGWNNSISIIARLDEHGQSAGALLSSTGTSDLQAAMKAGVYRDDTRVRIEANPYPVQIGKMYHWRIERRGAVILWSIDGREFMRFEDPLPLVGSGHDRFGFSSWESQLYFDNLRIEPLN